MKMHRLFFVNLIFIITFQSIMFNDIYANNKLSYVYSDDSTNFVSTSQVNAIEFCIPIMQVNSPPGQLTNIFNKASGTISYVNNNKTMLFYLANGVDAVQFMVTLKNGHVLSLHFRGDKSMGRVVRIPDEMSGWDIKNNKKKYQSYDLKIEKIMRAAIFENRMSGEWVKLKELKSRRYKNININKYTEWNNLFYKVERWDFCSRSKKILLIDYNKFNNGYRLLASTLTHEKLLPYGCAHLILLYAKDDAHAV